MIRVLIVEDSIVERELLIRILSADAQIQVIGTVGDGEAAIKAVEQMKPDIITMDIHMPKLNGIETTRQIMQTNPTPIIIVTNSYDHEDSYKSFQALQAGALAILRKPIGIRDPNHKKEADRIVNYVKLMSEIKVIHRIKSTQVNMQDLRFEGKEEICKYNYTKIIAMGASTGGPAVLQKILSAIPKQLPVPLLIVQHMTPGFLDNFIGWLISTTNFDVRIASHGELMAHGVAYFAPEDYHLTVGRNDRIILTKDPMKYGLRPSVASLFDSVAAHYGKFGMGILLTGMGSDGSYELKLMRDKGAITVAQDSESSIVNGMPGEAVKIGAAQYVLTPEQIIKIISEIEK